MNRRGFLRMSSVAAATGLAAQAEAFSFLARQPVSVERPILLADNVGRFDGMTLSPLTRRGDHWRYLVQWKTKTMPSLIEGQELRVMQKVITHGGCFEFRDEKAKQDELKYQFDIKRREIIRDCAWEEGWLERYRKAGYPEL